jgi:hypothetical protein
MTAFFLLSVALGAPLGSPLGLPPHESLMKMQALTKASRPSASSLVQVENSQLRSMNGQLDGQLDHVRELATRLPGDSRRRPYSMGIDTLAEPPTITFDLSQPAMKMMTSAPGVALFQRTSGVGSLVEKASAKTKQPANATNATKGLESLAEKATAKTKQPATTASNDQTTTGDLRDQARVAQEQQAAENAEAAAAGAHHVPPPEVLEVKAPEEAFLVPLGSDIGAKPEVLFQKGGAGWAVPLALVALLTER